MARNGPRVVVIGAGWNGISAAKTYLQIDPTIQLTILESESTLGGTWSAARVYPELSTQQPYGHYEACDFPLEQRDPDQVGGFIPSKRVHTYLEEYAEKWNLSDKVRYNTTVELVKRASDGVAWEIHCKGETTPLECDKLIVATGLTSLPNLPDIPTSNFTPLTFHSRYLGEHHDKLRSPDVKIVTVYGGGKSAYDVVHAAMKADKQVQWIIRISGEGMAPMIDAQKLTRRTTEGAWSPAMGVLQMNPFELGWSHWFFHSGKNRFGFWLSYAFWGFVSRSLQSQWRFDENENMRKLKPTYGDYALFWGIPGPCAVPNIEVIDRIRDGKGITVYRADITNLSEKTIHLSDGTSLQTDILVHATGYASQEIIFSTKDAYELGLPVRIDQLPQLEPTPGTYLTNYEEMNAEVLRIFPRLKDCPTKPALATYTQHKLYRSILPLSLLAKGDRSLAFVGYLQGTGISVIADISALWAAAWLSGNMEITRDLKEIEREVDYLNAFVRMRYGNKGRETPVALFEWISSTNAMLSDLGVPLPNVSRFKPWLPKVYRGLAAKWLEIRATGVAVKPAKGGISGSESH